jgi:hypothetical protein
MFGEFHTPSMSKTSFVDFKNSRLADKSLDLYDVDITKFID